MGSGQGYGGGTAKRIGPPGVAGDQAGRGGTESDVGEGKYLPEVWV